MNEFQTSLRLEGMSEIQVGMSEIQVFVKLLRTKRRVLDRRLCV